ncbi:MAG: hypothetical protein H0U50_04150 [Pyrinomonadaceae bacterium]|nr:hypothetical protein [Pyrinomonadaceae bacterium]
MAVFLIKTRFLREETQTYEKFWKILPKSKYINRKLLIQSRLFGADGGSL